MSTLDYILIILMLVLLMVIISIASTSLIYICSFLFLLFVSLKGLGIALDSFINYFTSGE